MSSNEDRIKWTKQEWQKLADECLKRYGYDAWPVSNIAAVRVVQKDILPENRRRPRGSMKGKDNIKPFHSLIDKAKKDPPDAYGKFQALGKHMHEHPTLSVAPAQAPVASSMESTLEKEVGNVYTSYTPPAQEMLERFPAAEKTVTEVLSTFIAGVLVESAKKLLTNGEIARMLRSLQNGVMPEVIVDSDLKKHNPFAPEAKLNPRIRQLECLVCGFRGHQQSEINSRTAVGFETLHLKHWFAENPNEGLTVLKQKAAASDVVLFSMENTSHSAVEAVQTLGRRIVRVTGGQTSMLAALQKLHAEQLRLKHGG
jgi:hypothetical protein